MAPFLRTRKHLLQNIGDGTFHHSGSLAVRAAVAAAPNITYKLLYNSAVAMTGGQDAVGAMAIPALTRAAGRRGSAPHHRHHRRAPAVPAPPAPAPVRPAGQHRRGMAPGPAGRGAGELSRTIRRHRAHPRPGVRGGMRRKRKRGMAPEPAAARVMINERVCEGCGDCGQQSNCLSVQPVDTEFGRKTRSTSPPATRTSPAWPATARRSSSVRPRPRRRRQHRCTAAPLDRRGPARARRAVRASTPPRTPCASPESAGPGS